MISNNFVSFLGRVDMRAATYNNFLEQKIKSAKIVYRYKMMDIYADTNTMNFDTKDYALMGL